MILAISLSQVIFDVALIYSFFQSLTVESYSLYSVHVSIAFSVMKQPTSNSVLNRDVFRLPFFVCLILLFVFCSLIIGKTKTEGVLCFALNHLVFKNHSLLHILCKMFFLAASFFVYLHVQQARV